MTRRLIAFAARLFPSAWRARYGGEFAATVEDMPAPGWAAVWDVCKGALEMQIHHLRNTFRMAAIFGALGLALSAGLSLRIPDLYLSESAVRAANVDPDSLRQILLRVLSRSRLMALIEKHHLYTAERSRLPVEGVIEKMRKNIRISPLTGKDSANHGFTVAFTNEDAAIVPRVTSDLVGELVNESLQPGTSAKGAGLLTVLNPASRADPIYPNRPIVGLIGTLGGVLLGAACAAWRRRSA